MADINNSNGKISSMKQARKYPCHDMITLSEKGFFMRYNLLAENSKGIAHGFSAAHAGKKIVKSGLYK